MSAERTFRERAEEGFQALREKVNVEEARRLALNGKRYVRTHPVTAIVASLSAGILIGYLAKAVADRRRNGAHAAS